MSFEEVVPRKEDEARGFRLCFRDEGGAAAGTSVVTRSYISPCRMSRDLVTTHNVTTGWLKVRRSFLENEESGRKKMKAKIFY